MKPGQKLLNNAMLYTIAGGLGRGLPFLLIPVLTTYLSVDDYGRFGLLTTLIGLITIVIGLNPHLFIISHFFRLERSALSLRVFNIFILGVITLIPICLMYWVFQSYIMQSLFGFEMFLLAITVAFNRFLGNLLLSIVQMESRADLFFYYYFCMSFVVAAAVIIAAIVGELYWTTMVAFEGGVTVIINIILIHRMFKLGFITPRFDNESFKDVTVFSAPLLLHVMSLWVIGYADRFILAELTDISSVGVYTLVSTLGLGFSLLHESAFRALQPVIFKHLNEVDSQSEVVGYIWRYYALSVIAGVLYTILVIEGMKYYLDSSYSGAITIFPIVILGYFFLGLYRVVAVFLYHNKDTAWLTRISFVIAAFSIILNLILVPKFGLTGTAIAMMISFGCLFVLVKMLITKLYKISWFRLKLV